MAYQKLDELLGSKMPNFRRHSHQLSRTAQVFRLLQYGPDRALAKESSLDPLSHLVPLALYLGNKAGANWGNGGVAVDEILMDFTALEILAYRNLAATSRGRYRVSAARLGSRSRAASRISSVPTVATTTLPTPGNP